MCLKFFKKLIIFSSKYVHFFAFLTKADATGLARQIGREPCIHQVFTQIESRFAPMQKLSLPHKTHLKMAFAEVSDCFSGCLKGFY